MRSIVRRIMGVCNNGVLYFLLKMDNFLPGHAELFNNRVSVMQGSTVPLICRNKEYGIPLGDKQIPAAAEWQEERTSGRSCHYFRGRSLGKQYFPRQYSTEKLQDS